VNATTRVQEPGPTISAALHGIVAVPAEVGVPQPAGVAVFLVGLRTLGLMYGTWRRR